MKLPINIDLPEGFLNEEIRQGYYISNKMKSVWAIELDLLVHFQDVCEQLGLKYFLDSGSLLGVIRNEKFIPWDDDIDVIMLRNDYDKLIKNHNLFQNPYFLQHAFTDNGYTRPHAQLRNSKTCAIIPAEKGKVFFNQGIFIDIFVLDGISDNWSEEYHHISRLRNYIKKIAYPPTTNAGVRILKEIRKGAITFRHGNIKDIYADLEEYVRRYNNTEFVDKVLFREEESQLKRLKRSWFIQKKNVRLEFVKCSIPACFDEILKIYYGNEYFIPKQEANMHSKDGSMIFDPFNSYTKYLV